MAQCEQPLRKGKLVIASVHAADQRTTTRQRDGEEQLGHLPAGPLPSHSSRAPLGRRGPPRCGCSGLAAHTTEASSPSTSRSNPVLRLPRVAWECGFRGRAPELWPIPLRGTAGQCSDGAAAQAAPATALRRRQAGGPRPWGEGRGTQIEGSSMQAGRTPGCLSGLRAISGDRGHWLPGTVAPPPCPSGADPWFPQSGEDSASAGEGPRLTGPACVRDRRGQGPWVGGSSAGTRRSRLWSRPAGGRVDSGWDPGVQAAYSPLTGLCRGTPQGPEGSQGGQFPPEVAMGQRALCTGQGNSAQAGRGGRPASWGSHSEAPAQ